MDMSLWHTVRYDIDGHSSVTAIAESLIANERLAKEAVLLLEAFIPGLLIESSTVSVRYVAQESPLKQAFVVALVAAYQKQLEKEIPAVITELTGINVSERYSTLLTILVMIIAVYGISKVVELLFPSRGKGELDKTYFSLTLVAGNLVHATPREIDTAVRARYSGKKIAQLTSMVRGFFTPTAGRANARIVGPDGSEIENKALAQIPQLALPETIEPSEQTETQFEYNRRIVIHAMDRDRGKVGWAAHIPALFADRVPMKLDKTIDPQSLFTKKQITGDVLIVYKVDEAGNRVPSEIHLLRIHFPTRSRGQ
jgi:hypothetical protein